MDPLFHSQIDVFCSFCFFDLFYNCVFQSNNMFGIIIIEPQKMNRLRGQIVPGFSMQSTLAFFEPAYFWGIKK